MSLESVQAIYAAFSKGDVATILAMVSPEVDWEYGQAPTDVPWLGHRHGREGVAAFFGALGANVDFLTFRPKEFLVGPGIVVVTIDLQLRVKHNGRPIREEDEVHIWRFDAEGRVSRFRHALDTAQHAAAWAG